MSFPGQVANTAIWLFAAVETSREHQHVIVALEASLHHTGEVTALASRLVDAYTDGLETWQIKKQVVHKITELSVIMGANDGAKRHTVLSSQRMIGHEGIKLAIVLVGQILHSLQLYVHLEILHALSKPLGTLKMTTFPQEAVHFILVNGLLEPGHKKRGHKLCLCSHLALQNPAYVNRFLYRFAHVCCKNI